MRSGHFLHCRDCETLFRPSPYDRAAEFRTTANYFTAIARDDCVEFLTRHARHRLETLRPTKPHAFHTGTLWDTTALTYWQVSSGDRIAIAEGRRLQIGGPLRYRLRSGRVITEAIAVEISERDIRQQVDRALYPGVAPARKLAAFVAAFKALVRELDAAFLEILYDVPGNPTLAVAKLPVSAIGRISACARLFFDQADSARLLAWLTGADADSDGLTVLVHQRVRVEG